MPLLFNFLTLRHAGESLTTSFCSCFEDYYFLSGIVNSKNNMVSFEFSTILKYNPLNLHSIIGLINPDIQQKKT